MKKCLDTYALVEISNGNPKFVNYLNSDIIITDLNLVEFYSVILREFNEQTADYWYKKLEQYSRVAKKEILIKAVKFRQENKKADISFFDAVGYIYSIENNFLFVTGDKEFENRKSVEFLKK